jgi:iron(III) transport system ATP-binding protein
MPPFLILNQLRKSFTEEPVLRGVSLEIMDGEILVLLGASGSGKTTLLRLIAGFEAPDDGSILVAGEEISHLPPERRNFGMVFQHYALFPHMTVAGNVAFGLEARRVPRDARQQRVKEVLPLVDLEGFEERRVQEISGGQQQRVALARALAPDPRLLLLDEPLSNLDPSLRERTRRQLKAAIGRIGITAVWVTHEQEEAFDVGDRVAILHQGKLQQVGHPEELYLEPKTRYVADFVGRASTLEGVLQEDGHVRVGDDRFVGRGVRWPAQAAETLEAPQPVELSAGKIVGRLYRGEATYYKVELEIGGELLVAGGLQAGRVGDRVAVALRSEGPPARVFRVATGEES